MSKDSVYQQLRSHLAYLGLPAAAEALPVHLDQARQHDTGHTEFLEALLRVEVETTEQRRWETPPQTGELPHPLATGRLRLWSTTKHRPKTGSGTHNRWLPG